MSVMAQKWLRNTVLDAAGYIHRKLNLIALYFFNFQKLISQHFCMLPGGICLSTLLLSPQKNNPCKWSVVFSAHSFVNFSFLAYFRKKHGITIYMKIGLSPCIQNDDIIMKY